MLRKLNFYQRYGVEEYYIYDPDDNELSGLQRVNTALQLISPIQRWVSPRLGIRFELTAETLEIHRPDGERFSTYVELGDQLTAERARIKSLEAKLRELGVDPEQV